MSRRKKSQFSKQKAMKNALGKRAPNLTVAAETQNTPQPKEQKTPQPAAITPTLLSIILQEHSPVTAEDFPRAPHECEVVPCLIRRTAESRESALALSHNCGSCKAPVHKLCSERVLVRNIIEDSSVPLFCSKCKNALPPFLSDRSV